MIVGDDLLLPVPGTLKRMTFFGETRAHAEGAARACPRSGEPGN